MKLSRVGVDLAKKRLAGQAQRRSIESVGHQYRQAQAPQRRRCRAGQQNSTHGLGHAA